MPDDKSRVKQGQTLNQTAQRVGDPRNMAKILGVAGEGLWDFLGKAQEYFVPQSVEELAMEGSPAGKAISAGIGLIPPKFFRSFANQLKDRILNRPSTPYKDILEEYIDRYPRVSAQLDDINAYTPEELATIPASRSGEAVNPAFPKGHSLIDPNSGYLKDDFLEQQLEAGYGPMAGLANGPGTPSAQIKLRPNLRRPTETIRHEFTHPAQNAVSPLALRPDHNSIPYKLRPAEIGARVAGEKGALEDLRRELLAAGVPEDPNNLLWRDVSKRFNGMDALQKEIRALEAVGANSDNPYMRQVIESINDRLQWHGKQIDLEPMSAGQLERFSSLGLKLGPAEKLNYRINPKIVLDR